MKMGHSRAASGGVRPVAKREVKSVGEARSSPPARPNGDLASVTGIPEAELTPKVRAAIMTLTRELERLGRELEHSRSRIVDLERLADQDSLVCAANGRAFARELSRMMSFAERYGTPGSVLYFDINGLKRINDSFGHAAGDAAIRHVAAALTQNVRESDFVGRLGGDEFGVILTTTGARAAHEKAASLAAGIEARPFEWRGRRLTLNVAYGACAFTGGDDVAKALDEADRDMYARKQGAKAAAWRPSARFRRTPGWGLRERGLLVFPRARLLRRRGCPVRQPRL